MQEREKPWGGVGGNQYDDFPESLPPLVTCDQVHTVDRVRYEGSFVHFMWRGVSMQSFHAPTHKPFVFP